MAVVVYDSSVVTFCGLELVSVLIDALHEGFVVQVAVDELVVAIWQLVQFVEAI